MTNPTPENAIRMARDSLAEIARDMRRIAGNNNANTRKAWATRIEEVVYALTTQPAGDGVAEAVAWVPWSASDGFHWPEFEHDKAEVDAKGDPGPGWIIMPLYTHPVPSAGVAEPVALREAIDAFEFRFGGEHRMYEWRSRWEAIKTALQSAAPAAPVDEWRPVRIPVGYDLDGLLNALKRQEQCDMDGVMCQVSRQAVDEAAELLAQALPPAPNAEVKS